MRLIETAVVGARVAGVTAIAVGVVLGLTSVVMSVILKSSLAGGFGSDLHLHDSYYVVSNIHYDLLVPSGVGLVVGVTILLMSRRLGRLLIRGLEGV